MIQKQETPPALIYTIFLFYTLPLYFMPAKLLADADTGWHVMAGHAIMDHLSVPQFNIFSYTSGDFPWLNLSWAWDVLAATIDSFGGLYLLSVFTIILGGLTMVTMTIYCLKRDSGTMATLMAMIFGMFGFMPALLVRPHQTTNIFSLFYIIILYFFVKYPRKWRLLLLLPLIMLFWANMHGGFFTGFFIIGAYLIQLFCHKRWNDFALLAAYSSLTFAAVFINPMGIDIFTAAYRTLGGPMKSYIFEWRAPDDIRDFIYIVLFTIVFAWSFRAHSLAEKIICIFWLMQTLIAVRNLPIFMIVSTPTLAHGIATIGRKYQIFRDRENDYTHQFSKPFIRKLTLSLSIILPIFFITPIFPMLSHFTPASKNFARDEIDYIIQNRPQARLLNHYNYGGYVIYESKGQLKTFIDGRAETAFPPYIINDYMLFDTATDGWESILDKYNIDTILIPKDLPVQIKYLDSNPQWKKAHEGPQAYVYTKN